MAGVAGVRLMVTPGTPAKGPVGAGTTTWKALKLLMLKSSSASQKALENTPLLVLMASWTSSLPKLFLLTMKDSEPSGMMQALSAALQ